MTVSSTTNRSGPYLGNGTAKSFAYEFRILDPGHLTVVRLAAGVEVVVDPASYSVTGVGDAAGGSVVFTVAPPTGVSLTIVRDAPFTQQVDLENQGAYYAETIERAFDLAVMRDQQQDEALGRSIKMAVSDLPANVELPTAAVRASKALVFDASGGLGVSEDDYVNQTANVTALAAMAEGYKNTAATSAGQAMAARNDASAAKDAAEVSRLGAYNFLVDTQGAAGVAILAKNDAQAAASTAANDAVAKAGFPASPTASAPLRRKADNTGYVTDPLATAAEMKAGDADKLFNILRLIDRLKYDGWLSARHFGIKCDGSAEDTRIDAALANGVPIFFPPSDGGVIPLAQPMVLRPGGGIMGAGEKTTFRRNFSGGPLISFDKDGGAPGDQIRLHDIALTRDSAQAIVDGDDGVQIGLTKTWGGRGVVRDVTIVGQWSGLKWRGGTVTDFMGIRVYEGKGYAFYGINARGSLIGCHAEYNEGGACCIYAASSGETGIRLISFGTFANQGFGLLLDAAPGVTGANVWLEGRFSSSYDGRGGIYCDKPYTQISWEDLFIEYAGYARQFKPAFTDYPGAKGLTLNGAIDRVDAGMTTILNCAGGGALLAGCEVAFSARPRIGNNGMRLGTGADRVGLAIQSGAKVFMPDGVNFEASRASSAQTTDLAVNTADCTVEIGDTDARVASIAGGDVAFTGRRKNIHEVVAPSASTLLVPHYASRVSISGTAQIDAIAPTFNGHDVTLSFQSTPVLGAGNNIKQAAQRTMVANQSVRAFCNGTNWYISG